MVCPPSRRLVSELSSIVPTCVPVLDGVSAFPKSCLPLSPFLSILVSGCLHVFPIVSHCLPLPPIVSHCLPTCACVGWSTFPKSWFSLPPIVSLDRCDLCCMVRPLSRGLVSPLSPIVSLLLFLCVGWCVHLPDVLSPLSPLSPSLSSFLSPSLSPNLSFFLFPFVVGGLILHFFKQCTVGVGFLKVSALVLDGVSAFPRSCLLYCLPLYPFFLVSLCLPLPIVPLLVSFCWMVRLPFGGSCLPVPPIVPLLDSPCWKVCSPCRRSCLALSPIVPLLVSLCWTPSRGCFPLYPWLFPFGDGVPAFLTVLSPIVPLLVSLCWMVRPPS